MRIEGVHDICNYLNDALVIGNIYNYEDIREVIYHRTMQINNERYPETYKIFKKMIDGGAFEIVSYKKYKDKIVPDKVAFVKKYKPYIVSYEWEPFDYKSIRRVE